jgi:hypothetical protein
LKKVFLPLSILCLLSSFSLIEVVKAGNNSAESKENITLVASSTASTIKSEASTVETASSLIYDSLQLGKLGLSKAAMLYAYRGQQYLVEKGLLHNSDILTVCDFSQPSTKKRMYIIDVKNFKVLMNTYVAHGRNSGLEYAERFSNKIESLESSLGFYITKNTYFGKHGLSLKLSGQEKGVNDNAEARDVVVHGAQYIGDQRAEAAYMGRSFGCPAVPQALAPKVINLIKDGTCLFIYHPSNDYLQSSTILNG